MAMIPMDAKWKNNWFIGIILVAFVGLNVIHHYGSPGDDLSSSYFACRLLMHNEGGHLYDHDPELFHVVGGKAWLDAAGESAYGGFLHPYVQSPLWAFALRPLCGNIQFPAFNFLFLVLGFAAIAATAFLTAVMWAPRFLDRPVWLAVLLAVVSLTTPVQYMAHLGQTHALFLFLSMLALFLADRRKLILAGLALAVAASVKLTPVVFAIYWLIFGQWRAAASFMAWMLILAATSIAVQGVDVNLAYLDNLQRLSGILLVSFNNQSFAAWSLGFSYPLNEISNWRIHPLPLSTELLGYGLAGLAFVFPGAVRLLKPGCTESIKPFAASLLLLASAMFANIAWSHYYIILIVPLMVVAASGSGWKGWLVFLVTVLNLWPISVNPMHPVLYPVTVLRSQFWSGVVCMAVLIACILTVASRKSASNHAEA